MPREVRIVGAVRRDRAADHEGGWVDRLDRVVRAREQLLVCARRHVFAVAAELGEPIAIDVGLVADDQIPYLRDAPREVRGERRELSACGFRQRRGAAAEWHHGRVDADAVEHPGRGDRLERSELVVRHRRLSRGPDCGYPQGLESRGRGQVNLRPGNGGIGVPALVLGCANRHRHRGSRGPGEEARQQAEREDQWTRGPHRKNSEGLRTKSQGV